MPRIEVTPGALRDAGAVTGQVGTDVADLAGGASSLAAGDGAPSGTREALGTFSAVWSRGVADLGAGLQGLGQTTGLAAGLYEQTDATAMPSS